MIPPIEMKCALCDRLFRVKWWRRQAKFCSRRCAAANASTKIKDRRAPHPELRLNPNGDRSRFFGRVAQRSVADCWWWTGQKDIHGYGMFNVRDGGVFKRKKAHRMALEYAGVHVPTDAVVMHLCDHPTCVNPSHLRVGTVAENSRDMASKRRSTHGERNPKAKLTAEIVRQIREAGTTGLTQREIAKRFGAHRSSVSLILSHKQWLYV